VVGTAWRLVVEPVKTVVVKDSEVDTCTSYRTAPLDLAHFKIGLPLAAGELCVRPLGAAGAAEAGERPGEPAASATVVIAEAMMR
jgi:hypothetical protein